MTDWGLTGDRLTDTMAWYSGHRHATRTFYEVSCWLLRNGFRATSHIVEDLVELGNVDFNGVPVVCYRLIVHFVWHGTPVIVPFEDLIRPEFSESQTA